MKRGVQFNRQRRMSRGSSSDMNEDEKSNSARSPTRNGAVKRPEYERTDTGADWATEPEGDEKVYHSIHTIEEMGE